MSTKQYPTFFWSGFAYATQECALLSITNTNTAASRNSCLAIEYIEVEPLSPQTFDGASVAGISDNAPFLLARVTDVGDGVSVPVISHTLAAALPSQVKVLIQAPVTVTDSFSQQFTEPHFDFTSNALSLSSLSSPFGAQFGRWGFRDTSTQGLVLREGYGIALVVPPPAINASLKLPSNDVWLLFVTLRDDTNNRTYTVSCECVSAGANGVASFVVFNGVGSGIVLSVLSIERFASGVANPAQSVPTQIRYMMTRGDDGGGEVVVPLAADPTYTPPSWARIVRGRLNSRCEPKLDSSGTSIRTSVDLTAATNPFNNQPISSESLAFATSSTGMASIFSIGTLRRATPFAAARQLRAAETGFAIGLAPTIMTSGFLARNDSQFIIPAGRGFAVVANNSSSRNAFWVELAFTYRTDTTPTARAFA